MRLTLLLVRLFSLSEIEEIPFCKDFSNFDTFATPIAWVRQLWTLQSSERVLNSSRTYKNVINIIFILRKKYKDELYY
jgi:hypothetical protein